MKITLCMLLFSVFMSATYGQIVSLNSAEIMVLKRKIKGEANAKALYQSFEKSAEDFLAQTPNPVDTIRTEGLLRGNPKKERTSIALRDMNKMYTLALQFKISGDKKYLAKANEFLLAWAKVNQPNGDPIDDTNLDRAIEAYDLIKDEISPKDNNLVANWLKGTALAEINSKRMNRNQGTGINNWNAHRLKVVGEIGYALNDQEFISWTIERFKKHIGINLNEDGTSLDFKERDAMHYHIYDLEPMLRLALLIKRAGGENFYTYQSPKASSIKKSVDWLTPYIKGEKQHEEYVNTTVKFDKDRAKNNEPGFAPGTMFKPILALPVLKLSVYFDSTQLDLLKTLNKHRKDWQMLIDEIRQDE
ncbi:alginate lyase family protein [Pedobacter sp. Leaf176]|uniref:alginate lyase family protein n=1 Tax=Pedobacter sp. Leaf176 TaxID=1736286 RepID=UPI0009E7FCA8|nr:alginate lyase family protein [Pedobacter sp. Leaf176]